MASTHINVTDYHAQIPGGFRDDKTWAFPDVPSVHASGKDMYWIIIVRAFPRKHLEEILAAGDSPSLAYFLKLTPRMFDNPPGQEDIYGWIKVESGLVSGKQREVVPTVVSAGKNTGKANATTPFCQALRDALGKYNKQERARRAAGSAGTTEISPGATRGRENIIPRGARGETTSLGEDAQEFLSVGPAIATPMYNPMLAKKLEDAPARISEDSPGFVQRKYNGLRVMGCRELADKVSPRTILYSRSRIEFPGLPGIRAAVTELLDVAEKLYTAGPIYFDGEAYRHGVSLQEISGDARRIKGEQHPDTKYMVYDCYFPAEPGLVYSQRLARLETIFSRARGATLSLGEDRSENEISFQAELVETFRVVNLEQVKAKYRQFLEEKYEGAILRLDTPYVVSVNGRRSAGLLKIKPDQDEEYEVVGYSSGKRGKAAKSLMLICRTGPESSPGSDQTQGQDSSRASVTHQPKEFAVTPALEIPVREQLLARMCQVEENGRTYFENHWLGAKIIVYFAEKSEAGVPTQGRTKMERRID